MKLNIKMKGIFGMSKLLELLIQISHGIASHFGDSCEIVIHDLNEKHLDSSIVYIENGHVSKRALGDGPSGIVLEALRYKNTNLKDKLSYLTKTEDGHILKSSTMFIREENEIRYIVSLNYDITPLLSVDLALRSLIDTGESKKSRQPAVITHNINDLLDELIEQSVNLVGKPVALMNKEEKIKSIKYLNDAGAFLVTRSGDKISNHFGISKFTLYSYIDSAKQSEADMQNNSEIKEGRNESNGMGNEQDAKNRGQEACLNVQGRNQKGKTLP